MLFDCFYLKKETHQSAFEKFVIKCIMEFGQIMKNNKMSSTIKIRGKVIKSRFIIIGLKLTILKNNEIKSLTLFKL